MSKRKDNSELFSKEIPEFTNEYRIKRRNNRHKQYGFVSIFLYDKRINKFIFESRSQGNSQYKSKISPIGGKREMQFEISKKAMDGLKTGNEIQLKINNEDIEKVFDAPDGFDIEHVVKLKKWDTITGDDLLIYDKQYEMLYKQEDIFFAMSREVLEETVLDIKKISCEIKYFGFDKKIFETDRIVTYVFLIIFDSYDFIPYSKEKKRGNEVIALNSYDILKRISDDKDKETKCFTPTIENVFEEVNSYCKLIKNEIILFGRPYSGLSEGVKICTAFFKSIDLEGLEPDHLSIRDLYPDHYHTRDESKE
ncbi:34145_t:CDS:2, partial [Racocetra persica]